MTINISSIRTPNNKINKQVYDVVSITGTLRTSCAVENPKIQIDISNMAAADLIKFNKANYAQIPEFNRYYFITDRTMVTDKIVELSLTVDVLKTYADQIMAQDCLIDRSEYYGSPYVVDNERPVYNFPMTVTKLFPGSLDDFHFYLTVATSLES